MGSPPRRIRTEDTTTRLGLPDARLQVVRTAPTARGGAPAVAAAEPSGVHRKAIRAAEAALRTSLRREHARSLRRADAGAAWDLELRNDRGERVALLVRGTPERRVREIGVGALEWAAARRMGTRYWLIVVTEVFEAPVVGALQNPAGQVQDRTVDAVPTAWRLTWPALGGVAGNGPPGPVGTGSARR
jgi:hypothetical protein